MRWYLAVWLTACLSAPVRAPGQNAGDGVEPKEYGHSSHGSAFDEGPRQRPWPMEGIGSAPFPITTSVPEVQEWFNQGNALLHSFWYYEAERAFRWCLRLDPDCAMAYWGLARSVPYENERFEAFLRKAAERKHLVSEKEQRYIDAWTTSFLANLDRTDPPEPGWNATSPVLAEELEKIIIDYPDDLEAKSLYVLNSLFRDGKYALEAVLQEVLRVAPDHPGAVHYRIHNWDSIELGAFALDSCARYGQVAWQVGHANHMPGHIYTKLGMWHEGAIWLDSATRVEKDYMRRRLVFPFNAWNYSHNRNFLAYAQSMLGMPEAALQGARDMLNAPLDPEFNKDESGYSVFRQGIEALRRTLMRFERWEEVLEPGGIPWRDTPADDVWRSYCESVAHVGLGRLDEAEEEILKLRGFEREVEKNKNSDAEDARQWRGLVRVHPIMWREAEARLRIARGETVEALRLLSEAAEMEYRSREEANDPPDYPRCLYNLLGEVYLDLGSPQLAIGAFERALTVLTNNGFSWSGLARAHHALGHEGEARQAFGRMLHVWSHAEPGIWQNEKARALGIQAEPEDPAPVPERCYATETLMALGPNVWHPYAAPELSTLDGEGNPVTLEQFRGKNVLLVFYLSDQCVHCVEQLQEVKAKAAEFDRRDTVVLAVSSDSPERNASSDLRDLPFLLLSDSEQHENAIRFRSYDEFEDLELHSTLLIDRKGRVRWGRTGGDPFMELDFILGEIDRIEELDRKGQLESGAGFGGR